MWGNYYYYYYYYQISIISLGEALKWNWNQTSLLNQLEKFKVELSIELWSRDMFCSHVMISRDILTTIIITWQYSQVHFVNEAGIDAGGLRREFFHLVFQTLTAEAPTYRSRQAFHGCGPGRLLPTIDADLAVEWRIFRFVGVVVVQAARARCSGLPGLCNGVRHFLHGGARISNVGRLTNQFVSVNDVADGDLRTLLVKVDHIR